MSGTGPKEGIYLDATLAAVGDRVEGQIDRIAAHRRRRTRVLVATLATTTLVGGAVTAAALTFAPEAAPAPERVLRSVRCIEGASDTAGAYFAVRFEIDVDQQQRVRSRELCLAAWDRLAIAPELVDGTPARLLALGGELLRATSTTSEGDTESPLVVTPHASTFGALRDPSSPPAMLAVCGADDAETVLFAEADTAVCTGRAAEG